MKNLFLLALSAVLLVSCGSVKKVPYIQDSDTYDLSTSDFLYDARIMPKDVLSITVNTVNPDASAPFNMKVAPGGINSTGGGGSLQTYLVDNEGCIEFPVLGKLEVVGLTKRLCEKMIHDKIMPYLNASEIPVVTVRMANYKIAVIGEVGSPGIFTVSNEKINIFEALAQAGDLTIYGIRDRVKIIRENSNGRKEIHTVNLNKTEIINSPYYYLQQNDIVYVEPNKVKTRSAVLGQSTSFWFTSVSMLMSITTFVLALTKRL
jgi:polysaccharide export outer membrane protein